MPEIKKVINYFRLKTKPFGLAFIKSWRILQFFFHSALFLGGLCGKLHIQGPVEQHGGEDKEDEDDGQDAAYLTNLKMVIINSVEKLQKLVKLGWVSLIFD